MTAGGDEVVYLAWGPLGLGPVNDFATALEAHPPPPGSRLTVIQNSVDPMLREAVELRLRPFEATHVYEQGLFDLEAYRRHAVRTTAGCVLFCNSYSRPLVRGWAELLLHAARDPGVGIAGATATLESHWVHAPWFVPRTDTMSLPGFLRLQVTMVARAAMVRLRWPGRSAGYVRTNGFAMRPEVMRRLNWPAFSSKMSTLRFESGRSGLTQQVLSAGLRTVIVERDGRVIDRERWRSSRVFRREGQPGLLIADNRTDEFLAASEPRRRVLESQAWGDRRRRRSTTR